MSQPVAPKPPLVILAAGRARRYGGCKPLAPVGPNGEAVIDLLGSDAVTSGFGRVIFVIGRETGPAIRYHVERTWPGHVDFHFALQEEPRGTVDAVVSANELLLDEMPFAVVNADDLYGRAALSILATHLGSRDAANALVGYRLRNSVIGTGPVTRGIIQVDPEGRLHAIEERRKVQAGANGAFAIHDGLEPASVSGDELVSLNLWGFRPDMRKTFQLAMDQAVDASEDAEVLLPELVGEVVAQDVAGSDDQANRFLVLKTESRCIGVTHPDDLALVQVEVAHEVAVGDRPAQLWT